MNSATDEVGKPTTKPPKPEEKPFEVFINDYFIPQLRKTLTDNGHPPDQLALVNGDRPVTGGKCWMVEGQISQGRRFWLCFSSNKISSTKLIAIAEKGSDPTVLESFLIDERRTTLALLISRVIQRLNGQKWLGAN